MGPPGSGKGTQASHIAELVGVHLVSSGDLFRENLSSETELGLIAKKFMEKGDYVPDDITIGMVMSWITEPEHSKGFVLDGFPRTIGQAKALVQQLGNNHDVDHVIFFDVPDELIINRLSGRLLCTDCQTPFHRFFYPPIQEGFCDLCSGNLYQRSDDKPEVVENRLRIYKEETGPVVEYFSDLGNFHEVDASKSIDEVRCAIAHLLGR